jgi:uncharacterized membrane protein
MIARDKNATTETARPNPERSDIPNQEDSSPDAGRNEPFPLEPLLRHLSELQMLAGHYLRARADQVLDRARILLFWAIAGLVGLIVAVAFLATAVVLLCRGIANGLMTLGLQPWAAELLTGIACIVVVATVMSIGSLSSRIAAKRKRRDDYEHFRARYRAKFGHGLDETIRRGK